MQHLKGKTKKEKEIKEVEITVSFHPCFMKEVRRILI